MGRLRMARLVILRQNTRPSKRFINEADLVVESLAKTVHLLEYRARQKHTQHQEKNQPYATAPWSVQPKVRTLL